MSRNCIFDIAKGIGIMTVVFGHAVCPLTKFFYLFHMPLFFILSGYFFKAKYYSNISELKQFFIKKLKSLYLIIVINNFILILLHNYFIKIKLYTTNPIFNSLKIEYFIQHATIFYDIKQIFINIFYTLIYAKTEQFLGFAWFLKTLLFLSIIYCLLSYIFYHYLNIKNKNLLHQYMTYITFFCFILGWICNLLHFNFYGIGTMLTCSLFYHLGILYKDYFSNTEFTSRWWWGGLTLLLIVLYTSPEQYNIASNKYYNPIILIITAISGFILVMYVSYKISKINTLSNIFSYIGRHTICILCLHTLAFRLITYLFVKMNKYPDLMLAAHPIIQNTNFWWLAYGIVGVCIPLLILGLYLRLKTYVKIFWLQLNDFIIS